MEPASWSEWQPISGWSPVSTVLAESLDGGQAFRWSGDSNGIWTGQWSDCLAQVRLGETTVEWRAPFAISKRVADSLPLYLGGDTDWKAQADALPWRSDAHLTRCMEAFPGLRLLRQPFGETLLGFLCSATKQIPQIKQMMALLAERHGPALDIGVGQDPVFPHRLPTWAELAAVSESGLRQCLLGFRARYIHATAQFIATRPGWLEQTEAAPYAEAKARLLELPGVGEKVADCVLLFGAGKFEAFPVDTWILRALERHYGLTGWKPAKIAHFGRAHFGPLAGLAQQYIFAWERKFGRPART